MKTSQVKGSPSKGRKIRIAVFGQHDVGKSALTVRYLTRRYIGEYKSNTDLLYRQTLTLSHGNTLDIEIIDISTSKFNSTDSPTATAGSTLSLDELNRADGFIIVYSITDRSSFSTARQALEDIHSAMNDCPTITPNSTTTSQYPPVPIALIANKCDLEHLRSVEKAEGISASLKYEGCQFYELSVAENSPEVYSSVQSIINSLSSAQPPQPKRKFSVAKMLGNLRIGRNNSPSFPTSTVSMIALSDDEGYSSPTSSREGSPGFNNDKKRFSKQGSEDSVETRSSIFHFKSKLHSINKRQQSPPICSL